eukprot:2783384-Heterocapsa_arctica.AAC.1
MWKPHRHHPGSSSGRAPMACPALGLSPGAHDVASTDFGSMLWFRLKFTAAWAHRSDPLTPFSDPFSDPFTPFCAKLSAFCEASNGDIDPIPLYP